MSGGASVEDTLDLWASGLRAVKERIAPLFTQKRVAASACAFLDVLIGNEPRKTGWMSADHLRMSARAAASMERSLSCPSIFRLHSKHIVFQIAAIVPRPSTDSSLSILTVRVACVAYRVPKIIAGEQVASISETLGYETPSAFAARFRRIMGVTLGNYR